MNNAITEIKGTLEGTNSRITEAEDRLSDVEDRMVEINETERKKEKRSKRNEDNLRDHCDKVKCSNIRSIGWEGSQTMFHIWQHSTADNQSIIR